MYAAANTPVGPERVVMTDWTSDAADAIERVVTGVRERTVDPVRALTKALVYGLLALLIGVPALLLLTVGAFRGLVEAYQGEVWAAWLTLGGIFVVAGGFLWAKRGG
jgi:hypothetical protein